MKFNSIKIALLACFIGITTSCSIDKIEPINQLTEELVITNEASADLVLNRMYNKHRNFFISNMAASTGFYGVEQDMLQGTFGSQGFNTNNVQDDSGLLNNYYRYIYSIINEANFFIKLVEAGNAVGLNETRKNEMLAEARFFRAMGHFSLLRVFGQFYNTSSQYGVVVSLTPISGENATTPIARSTVQESYNAIITDLEYAAANGGSGRAHLYVSATTARALLAKVQLYMGDYTNAATNALAVINNADGYSLEPVFADIFSKRWESSEVLFAPFADGFNESTSSVSSYFPTRVATPSSLFKGIADASDGATDAVDSFGAPISGYDTRFLHAYSPATRGVNLIGKYPFRRFSASGDAGNTFYYLRMAEVYLIYAEAEARRSGGVLADALTRLNEVRARAGVVAKTLTDQATLLNDIRSDKMIELCSENAEPYYDLVRYDQLGEVDASSFKATLTDDKFIFPIPATALAGNSLLVPNP